jgi:hypothetical protein
MTKEEIQKQIVANIMDRVIDLRCCNKYDSCHELAELIESYIPEWTDFLLDGGQ